MFPIDSKSMGDFADVLKSPTVPASPAPAYTTLPHRDVEFHFAPLLNNQMGDIELETTDGKRFLVHKKILEQETVFFHIYYGFVPVWRLNETQNQIQQQQTSQRTPSSGGGRAISNLLHLPKILATHIQRATSPTAPAPIQLPASPMSSNSSSSSALSEAQGLVTPPPPIDAPAPPPKDVTAPTPTSNPYTWAVPEHSAILEAFLSLIYPRGTFTPSPDYLLSNVHITARVIRASLGYQSQKALTIARNKLQTWIQSNPVEVYAMANFFNFSDLAILASSSAMKIPQEEWDPEAKALMGRNAASKLINLQSSRMDGLREILHTPMDVDNHSDSCVRHPMIQQLWENRVKAVEESLKVDSELLELLELDLRGGHCGDCLVVLGTTIQRCLRQAKDLPRSI